MVCGKLKDSADKTSVLAFSTNYNIIIFAEYSILVSAASRGYESNITDETQIVSETATT